MKHDPTDFLVIVLIGIAGIYLLKCVGDNVGSRDDLIVAGVRG